MANYVTLKKELYTYLLARTPFIVVQTSERERVERALTEISEENKGILISAMRSAGLYI